MKKTLKFKNIRLNKKEFHKSKEGTDFLSVDKVKHNDEGFKRFTG